MCMHVCMHACMNVCICAKLLRQLPHKKRWFQGLTLYVCMHVYMYNTYTCERDYFCSFHTDIREDDFQGWYSWYKKRKERLHSLGHLTMNVFFIYSFIKCLFWLFWRRVAQCFQESRACSIPVLAVKSGSGFVVVEINLAWAWVWAWAWAWHVRLQASGYRLQGWAYFTYVCQAPEIPQWPPFVTYAFLWSTLRQQKGTDPQLISE